MVVGSIVVDPVVDAVGLVCEYAEAYPEVSDGWEPDHGLYPELVAADSWRLPVTCHLVRAGDATVLVDTGVGPPGLWDWTAEDEGRLPESLDALRVRAEDVDVVFLTHLHVDHIGWNTDLEGAPLFPRARYVVHADALAFGLANAGLPHIRRCVEPLREMFETVTGDAEITPGVVAFELPGHYPGHMGLRITSEGASATHVADAFPHPSLFDRPDHTFSFDEDPVLATQTRIALAAELIAGDDTVICGHFPGSGIGTIERRDGGIVWEEDA